MTSATFTITIASAASTAVTITPVVGLVAPVPAGTKLADISIAPAGWTGGVSVDNPLVQVGGVSPAYTLVAASTLTSSVSGTVTVTP